MKQEEKVNEQETRIAFLDAQNSQLADSLVHWKKVAAGLKGKIKQLTKQVEHYKILDKEGDELNEQKIFALQEKDRVISGLQTQVNKLARINAELTKEIEACKAEIKKLTEEKKPWWKRLF